jgi:hypothetical protein
MASTSPDPLEKRIENLTSRNSQAGGAGLSPPVAAGQSPLHEVLIEEVAAALPEPVARQLRSAPTLARVQDWLAAGSIHGLASGDAYLTRRFLAELGDDPRRAALALARALAGRMQPLPDPDRQRADRLGLVFQLLVACMLLVVRAFLFTVGAAGLRALSQPEPAALLHGLVGLDLLLRPVPDRFLGAALVAAASTWLALEALAGARVIEAVRQGPARLRKLPPLLTWRADAFHAMWFLQATLLLLAFGARSLVLVVHAITAAECSTAQRIPALGLALLIAGLLSIVFWRSGRILRLGTEAPEAVPRHHSSSMN